MLHDIPIDFKVTNENDSKAMGGMLRRCKTILHNNLQVFTIKDITLEVNFIKPILDVLVAIPGHMRLIWPLM
jgi:hypothetical protein